MFWLSNISKLSEPTEGYSRNAINHRVIEIGDIYADLSPTIDATNNLLKQKL
jgi:hypothetical protein